MRHETRHSAVQRWLHGFTGLVVAGFAHLDRPWQEHARRNAFEAVAALRRDSRERLPLRTATSKGLTATCDSSSSALPERARAPRQPF